MGKRGGRASAEKEKVGFKPFSEVIGAETKVCPGCPGKRDAGLALVDKKPNYYKM